MHLHLPDPLPPWLIDRRTRYRLSWALVLISAGLTLWIGWRMFDTPKKPDGTPRRRGGNNGHAMIDFGGQWVMGRMLALGRGRDLYNRTAIWPVVRAAYPREDEIPPEERTPEEQGQHDAENLMGWLIGQDDPGAARAVASLIVPLAGRDALGAAALAAVEEDGRDRRLAVATAPQAGGALYPPIHALFMAPLGHLRPRIAYRLEQGLCLALAFVAGWGLRVLSKGRVWWPVGVAGILLFPGFSNTLNLAQNGIVMLTLLVWGWALLARDRPAAGGILWGLLAFKPVWAACFFLVPLLTRRWRFAVAMIGTGAALALATLPLVGWNAWLQWLQIGRLASVYYGADENWVLLSRDLLNIPRRWLLDFSAPTLERHSLAADVIGWGLVTLVGLVTLALAWRRPERVGWLTGPGPAFLLFGAWLCCFHFMFYDVILVALPVFVLLADIRPYFARVHVSLWARWSEPEGDKRVRLVLVRNSMTLTLVAALAVADLFLPTLGISASVSAPFLKWGPFPQPIRLATSYDGLPLSTLCVLALWLWCGWLTWHRLPDDVSDKKLADGHAVQLV